MLTIRAKQMSLTQTDRAKEMLVIFMRDFAKSKLFQHKVTRYNIRIQSIQHKFKTYIENSQKRYEILLEYYRAEK